MVIRIEVDQLLVGFNGLFEVAILDVPIGEDLVLPLGFHQQPLVEIERREPLEDVEPLRIQPLDFLEDGDGLGGESIPGEVLRDLLVELYRALELADPAVQIPDAVDDGCVAGKFLENLLVLSDGLLELSLLNEPLSIPQNLVPLDGHEPSDSLISYNSRGGTPITQTPFTIRTDLS